MRGGKITGGLIEKALTAAVIDEIPVLAVLGALSESGLTVRDASDMGYQVVMVEDACAAVTPALHQAAITNLKDAFCNVRTTDEVVAELAAELAPRSS